MKCPHCQAITLVVETRNEFRRRRECVNGHRFTATEVVVKRHKVDHQLIRQRIAEGVKPAAIAHECGVSEAWASELSKRARQTAQGVAH